MIMKMSVNKTQICHKIKFKLKLRRERWYMKVYSTPLSGWDVSNGDLTRDWNEQNSIEVGWVRSNDIASNDTTSDTTSSWNEPNGTSSADWSESNYALSTSWKWSNDGTNNERKPNGTFSGWDAPGSMVPGWNESDNTVSGWGEASHITVGWGDANNGTFKWGEMNTAIVEEETSHRHHSSWGKVQEGRSNWDASPCSIQKKEISSSQTNYGNVDYFASVHDPPPIGKSKSDLGSPPPIDTSIAWTQLADSGPKSPDSMFLSPIASPRHMQTLEKLFPQFLELVSKVVETGSEASIKVSPSMFIVVTIRIRLFFFAKILEIPCLRSCFSRDLFDPLKKRV